MSNARRISFISAPDASASAINAGTQYKPPWQRAGLYPTSSSHRHTSSAIRYGDRVFIDFPCEPSRTVLPLTLKFSFNLETIFFSAFSLCPATIARYHHKKPWSLCCMFVDKLSQQVLEKIVN